jgi:drug/metabolite transporter (DMT)-like permease
MKSVSIFLGLLAGLLFGIATPLSKIVLLQFNSFQLAGLLYLGAALTFLPVTIKNRKIEIEALRQSNKKKYLFGIILFGGILGPLFFMIGLKTANAMSVSIWINMELAATAVLGVLIFKDQLGRFAFLGVLLSLSAGVMATFNESASGFVSGFFVLLACISWGFDNNLTSILDGISPQTITFIKGVFGSIVNLTIGMFLSNFNITWEYIPYALLIGVFSYGISIVLFVITAQNLGATRGQVLFCTAPFWGILASYFFLGEPISIMIAVSFVLMVLSIILTNFTYHEHEHTHQSIVHVHYHSHNENHHEHTHEGKAKDIKHSHLHEHTEIRHTHKHFPDIHHRHKH